MQWPEWWDWDLEITPHIRRRMLDRGFTEVDLRTMLHGAFACERDPVTGRWLVRTHNAGRPWTVIVEPDFRARVLIAITAFPAQQRP